MSWDIYCCICGFSCIGANFDYLKEEFKNFNIDISDKDIKNIVHDIKWVNKKITLYANNKIKVWKNNEYDISNHLPFVDDNEYGILLHYDCWKFIKINYGIKLEYKNLPVNYIDINKVKNKSTNQTILMNINYGEITKYWQQFMAFERIYIDNNLYMIQSPLVTNNTKNINRIKKIVNQLKLKKELRPSPSISASFYKNNIIKIGNNNKFWIIKNKKWYEIKEDVIKKQFNINPKNIWKFMYPSKYLSNYLPLIGEYNIIPLFINNIKNNKLELIGTQNTISEFENNKKVIRLLNM